MIGNKMNVENSILSIIALGIISMVVLTFLGVSGAKMELCLEHAGYEWVDGNCVIGDKD